VLSHFEKLSEKKEAAKTIFEVFGTTRSEFKPPTMQTQSSRSNHYTTCTHLKPMKIPGTGLVPVIRSLWHQGMGEKS